MTVTLGDVSITVLGPGDEAASDTETAGSESGDDGNDGSMIIRVDYGQVSALYTGDAGAEEEAWLLDTWQESGQLDCDILKLGHHGSSSSSTEAFLGAVTPAFGVVSAGAGNSYGHPSASVLYRLEEMGISCLRTDIQGAVRLVTDGETLWLEERESLSGQE
jgi:competence protein ComEC